MSKHDETELPSIETAELSEVTGGNHRPGHNDAQLQAALKGITDSIKAVAEQKNNSGNSITQLLPFLMMAKNGGGGCPGGNCCR